MPTAGGGTGTAATEGAVADAGDGAGCSERPQATSPPRSTMAAAVAREVIRVPRLFVLSIISREGHMLHASGITSHVSRRRFSTVLLAVACIGGAKTVHSQTLLEYSAEARFQLDFHVPDA